MLLHIRFVRFVKHSASIGVFSIITRKAPSQEELRSEMETLCLQYPKYGYRRIRELLLRQGYPVGYRRVARLMKEANLCVAVKHVCQTTHSIDGVRP